MSYELTFSANIYDATRGTGVQMFASFRLPFSPDQLRDELIKTENLSDIDLQPEIVQSKWWEADWWPQ